MPASSHPIPDARAILELEPVRFHNPELVRVLIQQIVLIKGERVGALFPHQRRLAALSALVEQLVAVDELEQAVGAARLATALAPCNFINTVQPFLKGEMFLAIADRLLAQRNSTRAVQLLDEAWLLVDLIDPDEQGAAWVDLARRYFQAGLPERAHDVWNQAIAWAQRLEASMATPEHDVLQPWDGSALLARIVEDMLHAGQLDRAQEIAAAIQDNRQRAWALAQIQEHPSSG
jgi:tetratricopeptide (TPR) repeat protein